jgi:hypothetical protein
VKIEIKATYFDRLFRLFTIDDDIDRDLSRLAQDEAMRIRGRAPRATGRLQASIRSVKTGFMKYEVGSNLDYAEFADKGRAAGRMPPVDLIRRWLLVKGAATKGKDLNRMAYLVARKIARYGTKGAHFMPNSTEFAAFEARVKAVTDASVRRVARG